MAEMIHVSGFYLGDGEDKPVNLMIEDMLAEGIKRLVIGKGRGNQERKRNAQRNGKGSRECFKST